MPLALLRGRRECPTYPDALLVGAPGAGVADIAEPFDLGRHVGEPVKLLGGQEPFAGDDFDPQRGVGHGGILILIKSVITE
ncbi:MAG: hypothetical protein WB608_00395 [Terracidiphilus sp.]